MCSLKICNKTAWTLKEIIVHNQINLVNTLFNSIFISTILDGYSTEGYKWDGLDGMEISGRENNIWQNDKNTVDRITFDEEDSDFEFETKLRNS